MLKFTRDEWEMRPPKSYDKQIRILNGKILVDYDDVDQEEQLANAKLLIESPVMYGILKAIHELPILHDENGHAYKKVDCRSIFGTGATIGGLLKELDGEVQ